MTTKNGGQSNMFPKLCCTPHAMKKLLYCYLMIKMAWWLQDRPCQIGLFMKTKASKMMIVTVNKFRSWHSSRMNWSFLVGQLNGNGENIFLISLHQLIKQGIINSRSWNSHRNQVMDHIWILTWFLLVSTLVQTPKSTWFFASTGQPVICVKQTSFRLRSRRLSHLQPKT